MLVRTGYWAAAFILAGLIGLSACSSENKSSADAGTGGNRSEPDAASTGGAGRGGAGGSSGGQQAGGGGSSAAGTPSAGGASHQPDGGPDAGSEAGPPDATVPHCDSPDTTDTDNDRVPDACDDDDDNDGFVDPSDPAPKDATKPGAFNTPEQILANQHVKDALAAALAAGHEVKTYTEHGAPPISGYYVKPEGEGQMIASGNGDNVGNGIVGEEIRYTVSPDDEIASASIGYRNLALFGTGVTATGALLRGKDGEFTIYDRHVSRCLEPGSDSAVYVIGITNAHLSTDDNFKGYWLQIRNLAISIAVTGTVTDGCKAQYAGDLENVGGWAESEVPRYIPTDVADLQWMCVQDKDGYVPGEFFTGADGSHCKCDDTSSIVCGDPDGG